MPIKIPNSLPAAKTLADENIFVMTEERAQSQDIRPLKILLLNLMPTKIDTETQLLRLLSNTPLQIDIDLLQTATHTPKNTSKEHLLSFYRVFDEIKDDRYDGMIITGAPVEKMNYEEVDYWNELCSIMEWSKTHVYSTFHICWGAQAGLYYHYGIPKYKLPEKMVGIFQHVPLKPNHPLLHGFDDIYFAPHSRYTEIKIEDVKKTDSLEILTYSKEAGIHIVASKDGRQIFVTGHSEYDRDTLKREYFRDTQTSLNAPFPKNYFPNDNPDLSPAHVWKAHASLLFSNWLNYFVYQSTPYNLSNL